jgi:hypothetical protein
VGNLEVKPMHMFLKNKLLIGAVALVAAASAGGAYAATQTASNPRQAYLNDVAKRLNVTPAQLEAAMKGALIDRLNAAVKAGRLTQAQADQIKQRIQQGNVPFFLGHRGGPMFGRGLGGFGPPGGLRGHGALAAAATYLGLSDPQLINDLRSGKTLAQIATAQGKSVSGLETAMTDAVKSRLDRLVASGWITKLQEQRALDRLSARINRLVNRAQLAGPAGNMRPFPGLANQPGGPGPGGPALIGPPAGGPPPGA